MELNLIATGIELIGSTVRELKIDNTIVDIEKDGTRCFGLYINEPTFQKTDDILYAQMIIEFELEIKQAEEQECRMQFSIEGVFSARGDVEDEVFKELVIVNGAAALIGIARGKIEAISANIFNHGKIVLPFVNVLDYYKEQL